MRWVQPLEVSQQRSQRRDRKNRQARKCRRVLWNSWVLGIFHDCCPHSTHGYLYKIKPVNTSARMSEGGTFCFCYHVSVEYLPIRYWGSSSTALFTQDCFVYLGTSCFSVNFRVIFLELYSLLSRTSFVILMRVELTLNHFQ